MKFKFKDKVEVTHWFYQGVIWYIDSYRNDDCKNNKYYVSFEDWSMIKVTSAILENNLQKLEK